MFARFEIRQLDLMAARKILGAAIGMSPKEALFKGYIQLELELHEFDRARKLYEKYLEFDPTNCTAWIKFAELEIMLGDVERARAIFEIDFEFDEGERDRTRALYERLLEKSRHLKIWLAYARFEMAKISSGDEEDEEEQAEDKEGKPDPAKARSIYERAYKHFKAECSRPEVKDDVELSRKAKDQRAELVLSAWKPFEEEYGSPDDLQRVTKINPHKELAWEPSELGGMEEVWAWKFDDDIQEENPNAFKFLQMARAWKASANKKADPSEDGMDEDDDEDEDERRAPQGDNESDEESD